MIARTAKIADQARLAWFFGRLAVKERLAPRLHVRPLVAELFLTDNCNLRCTSCGCWTTNTKDELSTEEWRDVLRQLVALRIHKVNFTGGEPLIRPDAIGLMAYARDAGVRHLHLNSNGLRLTPDVQDQVLAAGVRSFNVSVDGPTALVHDRIRGRLGAFETTTRHLRQLIARRDAYRLKVRMNFTVMRDNVEHLPGIATMAQELGVSLYLNLVTDKTFLFRTDAVSAQTEVAGDLLDRALTELESIARKDRRRLPRYSDLSYLRGHFGDLVQRDLPCAESQLKLMVHSRGEVGGCWAHDPTASVRQRPIAAIVDDRAYRDEHAKLFRKECVGCGSNYSLNLRWRPRTYLADLQWRAGRRSLAS